MKLEVNPQLPPLRQPEYTGQNRCLPCTAVNVLIATAASAFIGVVTVSVSLALASFALFAGVIYLRGYLVPGTPTLTQRYLPDRVLGWFDKAPREARLASLTADDGDDLDPERVLREAGALEPCPDVDDLCLTPSFGAAWTRALAESDDATTSRTVADMLGVPESRLSIRQEGRASVVRVDDGLVGKWLSYEAMLADVAADRVLSEWVGDWAALSVERRSGVLRGLRVYLEQCPRCDGPMEFTTETRSSCCRTREVLLSRCEECGARLLELSADDVE